MSQRNLITERVGLDAGAAVAADGEGNVWVTWHAPAAGGHDEQDRRVWIARSRDEGRTFSTERQANPRETGCCACCAMAAFGDGRGGVHVLYRGAKASERHAMARRALASVGLAGWEDHTPAELSGGQQQRVAIARAIVSEPAVLLADEPTGNLDSQRSIEIMELLRRLNEEHHITVLMVTHEPDIASYTRRIVEVRDGHIIRDDAQQRRSAAQDLASVPPSQAV